MKKTWILVADEAIARVLYRPDNGGDLKNVEEITDAAAHASGSDLRRDAYGRRSGSAPHGSGADSQHRLRGQSSVTSSAGEDEQHQEAEQFAKRVADHLAEALQQQRFEALRIVAAPRFLGLLRKAMSPQLAGVVTEEIHKDLAHLDNHDITQRLFATVTSAEDR
ncbi:MAG: host attachment protein [Rubrivivax sp.]|nr:MAG: host attachment protein [Rubrivivax sp.]